MGKGIPDRWMDYTNMGRQIPGTRFIACKVPLNPDLLSTVGSQDAHFNCRLLMDHCPSLGLVIDLTNTDRYYDSRMLTSHNIEHIKLKTVGHAIPSKKVINSFYSIVEYFLERNKENEKLIAIHCTHGVNRTGYLICRYMIEQLGLPPDQAISVFNSARGHEQERINYLENLRQLSKTYSFYTEEENYSNGNQGHSRNQGRSQGQDYNQGHNQGHSHNQGRGSYGSGNGLTPNERYCSELEKKSWPQTLPYFPQTSRSFRNNASEDVSNNLRRSSRSRTSSYENLSKCSSTNDLRSPPQGVYGWSPYGPNYQRKRRSKATEEVEPPTATIAYQKPQYRGVKRRSRSNSDLTAEEDGEEDQGQGGRRRAAKSPKLGREYFENYYHGAVQPQYDEGFYVRGGGGVGPHRPPPRKINYPTTDDKPKQYRGPRQYKSPIGSEEASNEVEDDGPPAGKNPLSPSAEVFSPDVGTRRRSARFQPY